MFQRCSFSSMGLILNAHRAERSTNFLIMERRKYGAMLPAKTVWRLLMPYMGEHRKTTVADLPNDCTQVTLDSSKLKSTGDQGKNWTLQHRGWSFASIIRNIALAGWLFILSEFYHKIKKQRKKFGNIRKCSYLCPAFKNNAWQDWNKPSEGRMGEWLKPAVC